MMQVVQQQCQACGSHDHQILLVREPGRAQMAFVRCARCGELVARYRLQSYYHHGKGIESYLRSLGSDAADSGRNELKQFQAVQHEAVEQFERALEELSESR